jgi:hypothetical protein
LWCFALGTMNLFLYLFKPSYTIFLSCIRNHEFTFI